MPLPRKKTKDDDDAKAARDRLRRNAYNPSSRFLGDDDDNKAKEQAGVAGEKAVAKFLSLDPTPIYQKRKKDMKGYNLVGPNGEKINAYTSRKAKPHWLAVEIGHTQADIYVLCSFDGKAKSARLVGWATRHELVEGIHTTVRKMIPSGPNNHALYVTVLRDMDELKKMMVPHTKGLFDEPEAKDTP